MWDLDGTLVDSEEFHWLSWRDTMRREGVELTYEQFLASFGQRNDRILARRGSARTSMPSAMRRIGDAKEAEYRRLAEAHGLTPLPGAREWVERAAAPPAGSRRSPRRRRGVNVEMMLRVLRLDGLFDAIVVGRGRDDRASRIRRSSSRAADAARRSRRPAASSSKTPPPVSKARAAPA